MIFGGAQLNPPTTNAKLKKKIKNKEASNNGTTDLDPCPEALWLALLRSTASATASATAAGAGTGAATAAAVLVFNFS